jgi:hypothetical protein
MTLPSGPVFFFCNPFHKALSYCTMYVWQAIALIFDKFPAVCAWSHSLLAQHTQMGYGIADLH